MPAHDLERLTLTARQIALDALAVRVSDSLRRCDVPHVVIKGVTTATWLYEPPRDYRDVDVLIDPAHLVQAVAQLIQDGVARPDPARLGEEASHSQQLISTAGAEIDLHVTLPTLVPSTGSSVWAALADHHVPWTTDVGTLPALDVPGRCLVLAMHVLASGHDSEQVREDLRRALRAADQADWQTAMDLAARLGLNNEVRAAIEFVGEGAPGKVLPLRLAGASASAIQLDRLLHGGPSAAAALIREELYPSAAFMARYDPSSTRSRGAMAAARLRRLRRIVNSLPAAVRELRRRGSSRQ